MNRITTILNIFWFVFSIAFVGFSFWVAYSFNERLNTYELYQGDLDQQLRAIVPDYYPDEKGNIGTTERYIFMQEVVDRLTKLENKE